MMIFFVWIVFILLEQKADLNRIKQYVKKKEDFCNVIIASENIKILEFDQYQKSDKAPFIFYGDLEYIIEKIDGVKVVLNIHLQQK